MADFEANWPLQLLPATGKPLNLERLNYYKNEWKPAMTEMNLEQARYNMIEQQIRPWEVLNQDVLDLLVQIPREDFVPEAYRNMAFTDTAIPLPHGHFMLAPKIEARLLQAIDIQPDEDVLQVGTGSGYLCALMASMGHHVTTVDIHEDLLQHAQQKLAEHNIHNVSFECGDGAQGWNHNRSYNVIVVAGGLPILPESFQHSLKIGGRLFAFVGDAPAMEAVLITRVGENEFSHEELFETEVPVLENAQQPERFSF
jgi:protein-L-isoaspartate(D-aspartate) O-methyltransferase